MLDVGKTRAEEAVWIAMMLDRPMFMCVCVCV